MLEEVKAKVTGIKQEDNDQTKCGNEIMEVLDKYGLQFDVAVLLKAGQIIPHINLIPVSESKPTDKQNVK